MEAVTAINFNFTNGSSGHSADVQTVMDARDVQTGEELGTVIGDLGEVNTFSNEKLAKMFANFICTTKTTAAQAQGTTITRKYVDKTTLTLKSMVVLLRGIGCGPREDLDFMGEVPQFTEVINAPYPLQDSNGKSFPFPSLPPVRKGSVIAAGRIYNYETAAEFEGIKITLVYNNREFKPELSINDENVSLFYKNGLLGPDLAQYDLKYGYTLEDFKTIISEAGLNINWNGNEPSNDNILFEAQGTLSSVLGTVASYFGYFWYINPVTGDIEFVNSEVASALEIKDYTNKENHTEEIDKNIMSATFTEDLTTDRIVNSYSGTSEKKEDKSPKDDDRPKPVYFKKYYLKDEPEFDLLNMKDEELGVLFACFNQELSSENFSKFFFLCQYINKKGKWKEKFGRDLNYEKFYEKKPRFTQIFNWGPAPDQRPPNEKYLWPNKSKAKHEDINNSKLPFDRVVDKFKYVLCNWALRKPMQKAAETELYEFVKNYFAIAGGVYVSNGYSQYKADRMEFTNMNHITITGPYKGDTLIEDIKELGVLNDVFELLAIKGKTINDIARKTNDNAVALANRYHFVAIRNIPKLERIAGEMEEDAVDWKFLGTELEFYQHPNRKNKLWLGGPKGAQEEKIFDAGVQSYNNYLQTINQKKSLKLEYIRRKTRVNKKGEDDEEKEDDDVAKGSDNKNKMAELFDRFDYKFFSVEAPPYNLLNNLSLSSTSGGTTEMMALQKERGKYADGSHSPKQSSRLLYGFYVPERPQTGKPKPDLEFSPTISSLAIRFGGDGIQTTINESTIKLIPKDQTFLKTQGA